MCDVFNSVFYSNPILGEIIGGIEVDYGKFDYGKVGRRAAFVIIRRKLF